MGKDTLFVPVCFDGQADILKSLCHLFFENLRPGRCLSINPRYNR